MTVFQRAPTLGGECYKNDAQLLGAIFARFQRAPTLGGECYRLCWGVLPVPQHNAFQRAPTLGGECYCGVMSDTREPEVFLSTGTHPWG